jgi:hypothetical protein
MMKVGLLTPKTVSSLLSDGLGASVSLGHVM